MTSAMYIIVVGSILFSLFFCVCVCVSNVLQNVNVNGNGRKMCQFIE